MLESNHCRTSILLGIHFSKPRFSIANSFNEILDSISDLSDYEVQSKSGDEIVFKIGKIKVSLSNRFLIINNPIVFGEELSNLLPKKKDENDREVIPFPTLIYGQRFEIDKIVEIHKEDSHKFRHTFLSESIEIIKLLDKIAMGLPKFRFIGIVEYFTIPLNVLTWDILEKFKKEANISGGINAEKNTVNKYYFQKSEKVDERCFVFQLVKPDDHRDSEAQVAGASFDFQYIPENPKSIAEYGGPKSMVNLLASGIEELISNSAFLKFSARN